MDDTAGVCGGIKLKNYLIIKHKKMPTPSTSTPPTGGLTPCQEIENKINAKNTQLNNMETRLNSLLNNRASDLTEIGIARNEVTIAKKDLSDLREEQRKLGCPSSTAVTEVSLDNQTVISTSSVRRKDLEALKPVPMPTSSTTPTTPATPTTPTTPRVP
jgi:hypothetical protein